MYWVPVLITVLTAASISRFLRLGRLAAPLRDPLSARSPLLAKLFSCPQCLSFWISLLCAAVLARSALEGIVLLLLGWRGGYYANRLLDGLTAPRQTPAPPPDRCQVCGKERNDDFLLRRGLAFCSHRCWFAYLKALGEASRLSDEAAFDPQGNPLRQEIYPSAPEAIDVAQAHELLRDSSGCRYLDVRTPEEFAQGHPPGAVNIPLYLRSADELKPNRDFLRAVRNRFPRSIPVMVADGVGSRSLPAARLLTGAGYRQVYWVRGGYYGTRDLSGRRRTRGWTAQGFRAAFGDEQEPRPQPPRIREGTETGSPPRKP